jgi:hypothetical protein
VRLSLCRPLLIVLLAQSLAFAEPLRLEQVKSAEIDYWKHTGKREVSSWKVKATKEDVQAFRSLLTSAQSTDPKFVLFISSHQGVIETEVGEYWIAMGTEKMSTRPYRITLHPKGDPKNRKVEHYLLPKEAGARFERAVEAFLEGKVQRPPDRIEKR